MKARIAAVVLSAAAIAVFALPALAGAALPHPKSTLIVPEKSLGGIALGATAAKVQAQWGHTKECEFSCQYEDSNKRDYLPARAGVLLEQPASGKGAAKVWMITINAGQLETGLDKYVPDFNTPLAEFKTSKGIGLGSKLGEVQRAYPAAKKIGSPGTIELELKGKQERGTFFVFSGSTKVTGITVLLHPGG